MFLKRNSQQSNKDVFYLKYLTCAKDGKFDLFRPSCQLELLSRWEADVNVCIPTYIYVRASSGNIDW